ncbi:unnamed protein product [Amoebophrya sp. A25]|nr:unnamed protein product [Amoebophrya sp. A25]|eukprot:GSA25T00014920001.1
MAPSEAGSGKEGKARRSASKESSGSAASSGAASKSGGQKPTKRKSSKKQSKEKTGENVGGNGEGGNDRKRGEEEEQQEGSPSDAGSHAIVAEAEAGGANQKSLISDSDDEMGESTEEELAEAERQERQREIAVQQRLEELIQNIPRWEGVEDGVMPREDRTKDCMEGRVRDVLGRLGAIGDHISTFQEDTWAELEKVRESKKGVKTWFRNTAEAGIQTAIGEALDAIKGLSALRGQLMQKIDKQLSQNKSCIVEARSIRGAAQKLLDQIEDTRKYTGSIGPEVDLLVQDWQDNVVNGKKHMMKQGGRFVKQAEKAVDRLGLIRTHETRAIDDDIYSAMILKAPKTARKNIFELMDRREPQEALARAALGLPPREDAPKEEKKDEPSSPDKNLPSSPGSNRDSTDKKDAPVAADNAPPADIDQIASVVDNNASKELEEQPGDSNSTRTPAAAPKEDEAKGKEGDATAG